MLMKGDEVVEAREEGTNCLLLGHARNAQWKHPCRAERKVFHRATSSSNLYVTPRFVALKRYFEELAVEALAVRSPGI